MTNQYGLVTTEKHQGSGSLYIPPSGNLPWQTNNLSIVPAQTVKHFKINTNEDFIISFWAKYETINVSTLNQKWPLVSYGPGIGPYYGTPYYSNPNGWEFGVLVTQVGGSRTAAGYFSYNGNIMTSVPNSQDYRAMGPTNNWCRWEASRINGVVKFKFLNPDAYIDDTVTQNTQNSTDSIAYYGQGLDTSAIYIKPSGTNNTGVYIDEMFMARGTGVVQNTRPVDPNVYPGQPPHDTWQIYSEIADGGLETTLFLYHFNGNFFDDQTGNKVGVSNLYSVSTISVNAGLLQNANSSLTSSSSLTSDVFVYRLVRASATLTSTSAFSLTANANRVATTRLESRSELISRISVLKTLVANISSSSTETANIGAVRNATVYLSALSSELILGSTTNRISATLSSASSIDITAKKTANTTSNLSSATSIAITAIKQATLSAQLNSISSIRINLGEYLISSTRLTANISKRVNISQRLSSTTSLVANNVINKISTNNRLNSTTTLTARGIKQSNATANLYSTSRMSINLALQLPTTILYSTSSLTATALTTNIDINVVWMIPKENRNWIIEKEHRDWIIDYEERKWIIQQET